jgi:hypothetical protein
MPDYIFRGPLGAEEEKIYGRNNWWDWSIENWGTKWNSYGGFICYTSSKVLCFAFKTAWSMPKPVFEELCKQNKECRIVMTQFADEDIGSRNCGRVKYTYVPGKEIEFDLYEPEVEKRTSFARRIWSMYWTYSENFDLLLREMVEEYKLKNPTPVVEVQGKDLQETFNALNLN